MIWGTYVATEDRHWRGYSDAGDGAFGRGNYAYAERMYKEALEEALRLDPNGAEAVRSMQDLSKAYRAIGKNALAAAMLDRARSLRR